MQVRYSRGLFSPHFCCYAWLSSPVDNALFIAMGHQHISHLLQYGALKFIIRGLVITLVFYYPKTLAKRLYISLDFCYTFVLQKSSDVLCYGQTVRHFTIQFIRLHRRFSPSQQQTVKQHKRAQIFMIKWSAIEENNFT